MRSHFPSRRTLWTMLALPAALALGLSACASGTAAPRAGSAEVVPGGTIHWAIRGANLDEGHMDPHQSQLDVSAMVARATLDSLTFLGQDGELQPWLATEWTVSSDLRSVEFSLRDDVFFHDGTPFTAAAVKANFDHIMADETESTSANELLGGDRYAGTEVLDETTVRVSFTEPFAPFLKNTSSALLGMYSPATLKAHADQLAVGGPGITVGSGPWVMTDIVAGTSITYTRNADYAWAPEGLDAPETAAAQLRVSLVPENALRAEQLVADEVQVASELSPLSLDALAEFREDQIFVYDTPGIPYSLYLNESEGPLADQAVRQALLFGADLESAVDTVYNGTFSAATGVLSPTTPGVTAGIVDDQVGFDPERAERLLDAAGWVRPADGEIREKDGEPLELSWISWTPRDEDKQALSDLLVDSWRAVGISVTNEVIEPGEYNERYGSGAYDLTDWAFASLDPDILRNHLATDGFQNASRMSDPDIDELLSQGVSTLEADDRTSIYDRLVEWNAEHVAILPVYNPAVISATGDRIRGVVFDANGWPLFHAAEEVN